MKKKIAIIGAGISGLSVANMLERRGHNVIVFEKESTPGGLVRCTLEDGVLFHRVGGHVFNTKIKKVSNWITDFLNFTEDFNLSKRNAKILLNNSQLGYPIENYIYNLPEDTITKIITELLNISKVKQNSNPLITNFKDFLIKSFGETLYSLYFEPYNKKIWNAPLEDIPLPWLDGKLPMPNIPEIILNNILRKDETKMVHSQFYYAKQNGSQFIINQLSAPLKSIFVGKRIEKFQYKSNKKWEINNLQFDSIIYTGDIRLLHKNIIGCDEIISSLSPLQTLKSNGTSNVLCEIDKNDLSWLYIPSASYLPHRIIYTGNFSKKNNGTKERTTCTIEFSGIVEKDIMLSEIEKLPGNPIPIAFNFEENSYIIHDHNTSSLVKNAKRKLETVNFHLLGRFAEWEYYNMDTAIEAGLNLVDEKFN